MNNENVTYYILKYGNNPSFEDLQSLFDDDETLKIIKLWLADCTLFYDEDRITATKISIKAGKSITYKNLEPFEYAFSKQAAKSEFKWILSYGFPDIPKLYKMLAAMK